MVNDFEKHQYYYINMSDPETIIQRKNNKDIIRNASAKIQITVEIEQLMPVSAVEEISDEDLYFAFVPNGSKVYEGEAKNTSFTSSFSKVNSFGM